MCYPFLVYSLMLSRLQKTQLFTLLPGDRVLPHVCHLQDKQGSVLSEAVVTYLLPLDKISRIKKVKWKNITVDWNYKNKLEKMTPTCSKNILKIWKISIMQFDPIAKPSHFHFYFLAFAVLFRDCIFIYLFSVFLFLKLWFHPWNCICQLIFANPHQQL